MCQGNVGCNNLVYKNIFIQDYATVIQLIKGALLVSRRKINTSISCIYKL